MLPGGNSDGPDPVGDSRDFTFHYVPVNKGEIVPPDGRDLLPLAQALEAEAAAGKWD